ncbi:MAG: HAD family phosphatase [Dysgonomonas sp.]|nr:HAD family phosphatase [Dysgonomonas sp.]
MSTISTILFDFDGVITNTEPQYDIYFDALGKKYLGIPNLAEQVKGVTSNNILKKHFCHFSKEEIKAIDRDIETFERQMDFPSIDGAIEFIHYLKEHNYNVGLVTSSQRFKMDIALEKLNLTGVFDIEITADNITEGKPNPMCYLLGAKGLNVSLEECLVFEDSLFGVQAAKDAGMRVVGLSTTVSGEQLQEKGVEKVIPDFVDKAILLEILA